MLDCTFGGGNHSVPLLQKYDTLKVVGVDLDNKTLSQCKEKYENFISEKRLALEHSNFVNVTAIDPKQSFKRKVGVKSKYDVALLDLGFSSYQLDDKERGFSYMGPDD